MALLLYWLEAALEVGEMNGGSLLRQDCSPGIRVAVVGLLLFVVATILCSAGCASSSSVSEIEGWWSTAGQYTTLVHGDVCHHVTADKDYVYQYSTNDYSFSLVTVNEIGDLGRFDGSSFGDSGKGSAYMLGRGTYLLYDDDKDVLVCRNLDGSGYSMTSSLNRMITVPESLLEVDKSQREGGSPPSSAAAGGSPSSSSVASSESYDSPYFTVFFPESWSGRWSQKMEQETREAMNASNYYYTFSLDGVPQFGIDCNLFSLGSTRAIGTTGKRQIEFAAYDALRTDDKQFILSKIEIKQET